MIPSYTSIESNVARKILATQKYYLFGRVKTMCQEWPGCERWALKRHKENPSFTIIDAEVEYYVEGYNTWRYNLYVETMENLQTQTYVFVAKGDKFNSTPFELKKFPGHPFTDMPSEHAKYEWEIWNPYNKIPTNSNLVKRWAKISDVLWEVLAHCREQQRIIWDKNGNPRWERRIDITLDGEYVRSVAVIARQKKLGDPFEFISARRANSILKEAMYRPSFHFVKKY